MLHKRFCVYDVLIVIILLPFSNYLFSYTI